MPPKLKFEEGEKVLCSYGPLIYDAKCLKISVKKHKHVRYYIHYVGWNKRWDEWVPESRLLKYTEANVQKQVDAKKAQAAQQSKTKKAPAKVIKAKVESDVSTTTTASSSAAASYSSSVASASSSASSVSSSEEDLKPFVGEGISGETTTLSIQIVKTESDGDDEDSSDFVPHPLALNTGPLGLPIKLEEPLLFKLEVKIRITRDLREWLVYDWDLVIKQRKLVVLPAKCTVSQIIDTFLAHKDRKDLTIIDTAERIKEFFDVCLGSQLLYNFERAQYNDTLEAYPGTPMSNIYGAIHLLRLFSNLGQLLGFTSLDPNNLQPVISHTHDLIRFIDMYRMTYLSLDDYEKATPEYLRKVGL